MHHIMGASTGLVLLLLQVSIFITVLLAHGKSRGGHMVIVCPILNLIVAGARCEIRLLEGKVFQFTSERVAIVPLLLLVDCVRARANA